LARKLQPGQVDHIFRSVASDKKIMEFEEHGEVDFSLGVPNLGASVAPPSASAARPHWCSATCATRSPPPRSSACRLVLNDLVMEKNGLIVVVGATGSGKSTSLAAMIDHRNSNAAGHILTLEDPIEYLHHHKRSVVAQREIGVDTESYSSGIRSAMRSAPNVILLG
jgi:twitching motility protein PilU